LLARTNVDPLSLASAVRQTVLSIDPALPLQQARSVEEILDASLARRRFTLNLLGVSALLALLLAAVGIYGVLSYTVSQRTQEIGIRLTLGATRRDVLALVVGDGMRLALVGIVIGLVASYGVTDLMKALLFEVSPHDPTTFVGLAALLIVVALVASTLPGLRATRVSPIDALRQE
jgi:putative ABC transport system permease protein